MSDVIPTVTQLPAALLPPLAQAHSYAEQSAATNTKRAYAADWRVFVAWCEAHGAPPLPADPTTLAAFLADEAERRKVATINRRLVAIKQAHELAEYDSPTYNAAVQKVMKGIRRAKGAPQTQKQAATLTPLRLMLATCDTSYKGLRDAALLLLGYAGALRRSELAALDYEHIQFEAAGVVLTLQRSKTDQEGHGYQKAIPYGMTPATCPVRALERWLQATHITSGPIFCPLTKSGMPRNRRITGKGIADIVKDRATAAGLDASKYSGHSLRAGLPTDAGAKGLQERDIMEHTGHKSVDVARRYIRRGSLFNNNIAGQVGL